MCFHSVQKEALNNLGKRSNILPLRRHLNEGEIALHVMREEISLCYQKEERKMENSEPKVIQYYSCTKLI